MSLTRVKFLFIFITVLWAQICPAKDLTSGPFYWQKPEIQKRMQEDRYIPVSVTKDSAEENDVWMIKGAGLIRAPCEFAFEYVQDFSQLKKMSDHFPEVSWNQDKTELQITAKILTREQKMKIKLWRDEALEKEEKVRCLHYQVVQGAFSGAEGVLILRNALHQQCESGFVSRYQGKLVSFGSSLFAIAVEGLLSHVARSLRSGVENAWTK